MTDTATLKKPEARAYVALNAGDPAPWFHQRSSGNPRYAFDTAAGRYIVMCFYLTVRDPQARLALAAVAKHRQMFDDERIAFFGVSLDPGDEKEGRVKEAMPGIRFLWDFDATVSKLYGAVPTDAGPGEANLPARRFWIVLDPTLRVSAVFPFQPDGGELEQVFDYLKALPRPEDSCHGAGDVSGVFYGSGRTCGSDSVQSWLPDRLSNVLARTRLLSSSKMPPRPTSNSESPACI